MSTGLSIPACLDLSNDAKSGPWNNPIVHHLHHPAAVSRFCACVWCLCLKDWLQSDGQPENKASFYFEEHRLLSKAQTL